MEGEREGLGGHYPSTDFLPRGPVSHALGQREALQWKGGREVERREKERGGEGGKEGGRKGGHAPCQDIVHCVASAVHGCNASAGFDGC